MSATTPPPTSGTESVMIAGAKWNKAIGGTISRLAQDAAGVVKVTSGEALSKVVEGATDVLDGVNDAGTMVLQPLSKIYNWLIPNEAAADPLGCYVYLMKKSQAEIDARDPTTLFTTVYPWN